MASRAASFLSSTTRRCPRRRSCACCSRPSRAGSRSPAPSRRRRRCCSTCSSRSTRDARVFALDTHVLFPETYAVWREVERRYGIDGRGLRGPVARRARPQLHGEALWERKPDLCCAIRKVAPLGRALAGLDAWITGPAPRPVADARRRAEGRLGRRRTSSGRQTRSPTGTTRAASPTSRERGLPYNELHDRGYASIGCTHCTQPGRGPRGPLGGLRQDRVRPAHRLGCAATPPRGDADRGDDRAEASSSGSPGLSAAGKSTIARPRRRRARGARRARRPARRRRRPRAPLARASASRRTTATRTSSGSAGSPRGSPARARRSSSRRSRPTRRRGRRRAR